MVKVAKAVIGVVIDGVLSARRGEKRATRGRERGRGKGERKRRKGQG